MLKLRWTYRNPRGLTDWYGHVDYFDQYVIGQWFVLDSDTGVEYWSHRFLRANNIVDCQNGIIVASEMRSDGPWTVDFGIYGIDVQTGKILWINHGRGILGVALYCCDFVPGFTNELRDAPEAIVDNLVVTRRGRCLDIRTGRECQPTATKAPPFDRSSLASQLYHNKTLEVDGDTISVDGHDDNFSISRRDANSALKWCFHAKDHSAHVGGNYFTYRLHNGFVFIIVGDAPSHLPVRADKPWFVRSNSANYRLLILNISNGDIQASALELGTPCKECRIEAFRDSRVLISFDRRALAEYEFLH